MTRQLPRLDPEGLGEAVDVVEGDASLAVLNLAPIGPIEPTGASMEHAGHFTSGTPIPR